MNVADHLPNPGLVCNGKMTTSGKIKFNTKREGRERGRRERFEVHVHHLPRIMGASHGNKSRKEAPEEGASDTQYPRVLKIYLHAY